MTKENKGVTLIALIITIIVIIILSIISINMIIGDNGILQKAKMAKSDTDLSKSEEESKLNQTNDLMENYMTSRGTSTGITQEESSLNLVDPSAWSVVYNKVIRTGNQCTVMFGGTYNANFNYTSIKIANLPFLPKYMITDAGAVSSIDVHQIKNMLYVYLGTNGQLNVADWGGTSGKTIVINTTYICQ